ncbi:enoyl-CoA hydratase/isomerase family protein [Nocardia bovistercoris]|uniref:Enoyl-CoA hydratase/isomerase family protein n=1 Tax=Nocardia bovistercoris TaxID=2785916 RepID=A0A931N395_9NOCA|nr:enoyl-CoA hydratase-related protein [Nocardia bovistercoris]MBH0776333.1 enoyl-CoA hydratase/isomerase family protein [Nocardia bovistercoris]
MSDLEYNVTDYVATIQLNRPEKRNAFTLPMVDAWADRLLEAQADPQVRVIVITGAGQGFCSGVDLSWIEDHDRSSLEFKQDLTEHIHRVPLALESVDKPVIAAINGDAVGAGLDMALMCDLRLASTSARLAMSYIKVGLVPGDGGCWLLPRLVGLPRALELLWTGDMITAERALELGMLNAVHDSDDLLVQTYELAARLTSRPPVALRMIKRATYQSQKLDFRTSLDLISSHMGVVRTTADSVEAYRAFAEMRTGQFTGR